MKKINIGIVGLGKIAESVHIPILTNFKEVKLKAAAELNQIRGKRLVKKWNISNLYERYEEMYENENLDAIYICLPHHLHFEAVNKALDHGLNVFCEKPMSTNSDDAHHLVEKAKKYELILAVGYNRRLKPNFQRAAEIIKSGKLGKIVTVNGILVNPGPYSTWIPSSDWFFNKESGGVLLDSGSHLFDVLTYILDDEIIYVNTESMNVYKINVFDNIVGSFKTQGETIGTFNIGWGISNQYDLIQIHGTAGSLLVSSYEMQEWYGRLTALDRFVNYLKSASGILKQALALRSYKNIRGPYAEEDRAFIDSLLNRKITPTCTGERALVILEILDAIRESLTRDQSVKIKTHFKN